MAACCLKMLNSSAKIDYANVDQNVSDVELLKFGCLNELIVGGDVIIHQSTKCKDKIELSLTNYDRSVRKLMLFFKELNDNPNVDIVVTQRIHDELLFVFAEMNKMFIWFNNRHLLFGGCVAKLSSALLAKKLTIMSTFSIKYEDIAIKELHTTVITSMCCLLYKLAFS